MTQKSGSVETAEQHVRDIRRATGLARDPREIWPIKVIRRTPLASWAWVATKSQLQT